MPRIIASTDGTTTTVVGTIHLRPVLVKQSRRQDDYIVGQLRQVSARVHGQPLLVAEEIVVVSGCADLATARTRAKRRKGGFVLQRRKGTPHYDVV